jgi:serine/threonine protein kinase
MSRTKILGDTYRVGEAIGHGAFSSVYSCTHLETHAKYAVKVLNKHKVEGAGMAEAFEREVASLRAVESRYVTNAIDVLASTRNYYLVMDIADRGTLLQLVVKTNGGNGLPPQLVRKYFSQILLGIRDMHHSLVVHRDLKPENMLVDEWSDLKISDFGFAARADEHRVLTRQCGTPQYVAPEVLSGQYKGRPVDVWSAGVTLYVLLCGYPPFSAPDVDRLCDKIREGRYPKPRRPEGLSVVPPAALHLLSCCLCLNPEHRWTAEQLLKHPYLQGKDEVATKPVLHAHALSPPSNDSFMNLGSSSGPRFPQSIDDDDDDDNVLLRAGCEPAQSIVYYSLSCPDLHQPSRSGHKPGFGVWDPLGLRRRKHVTLPDGADETPVPSALKRRVPLGQPQADVLETPALSVTPTPGRKANTGTPKDGRFTKPLRRRFGLVHVGLLLHFLAVCVIVLVVGALRLLFDIKLSTIPLPSGIRQTLDTFLDIERPADVVTKKEKGK